MSGYAEKIKARHVGPDCVEPLCENPATKLVIINGGPQWVCAEHYHPEAVGIR